MDNMHMRSGIYSLPNEHCPGESAVISRRSFVRRVAGLSLALTGDGLATAAVLLAGCGGGGGGDAPQAASSTAAGNQPPVWQGVPDVTFTQGVAASVSIASFVSDADAHALVITLNNVPLPDGVTFDAAGKRFVYDGAGAAGSTSGHVLTADDGAG